MKNNLILIANCLVFTGAGFLNSCQKEPFSESASDLNDLKRGNISKSDILFEIGYDIETSCDYKFDEKNCSNFDLAYLNPSSNKERIYMKFYADGTSDLVIEKLVEKGKLEVKHKVAESDIPEIAKTVISGGEMSLYQKNGKLINTIKFPQENNSLLVENLKNLIAENSEKDIVNFIYTMQGSAYSKNIEKLIEQSRTNGNIIIEEYGDTHLTLRMKMSEIDQKSTNDMVLLIDRTNNRMVGNRIYNEKGELQQSTYIGYN